MALKMDQRIGDPALTDAVAALNERMKLPRPSPLPEAVKLADVREMPELFQPRGPQGIAEFHISDLVKGIQRDGRLEAITVLWVGSEPYVIDGHHRVAAYEAAGFTGMIPVRHFEGTVEEAILVAGKSNTLTHLAMSNQQRQDYAWKLVRLGVHSKSEIVSNAGISNGQVAVMRRALLALGVDANDYPSWWKASKVWKRGDNFQEVSGDQEQWLEELAADFAERLAREFSTKLAQNPKVAARAFDIHFGRKIDALYGELREYVAEKLDEADGDF